MPDAVLVASAMAVPAVPAVTATAPPRRRRVFHVQLSATECTEINFKDLVREFERVHGHADATAPAATTAASAATTATTIATTVARSIDTSDLVVEEIVGGLPLSTPRTQRFDIIERLEKRYGGGAVVGPPVKGSSSGDRSTGGGAANDDDDGFVRGDDDDLYDSEDSFIDDEELHQNIEEIHTQARVQTKHTGFFVNAGDEIETIGGAGIDDDDHDDTTDAVVPAKKTKRAKKGGAESSRAVKAFLDEWSEAASDWQPGPEIVDGIDALRRAVHEMTETTPFTKVFPRQLDDALRAVDRLVVDAHPNKWRVNGYFATLMTFLPFTKQYLKSNMLRLEARDAARTVKEEMEQSIAGLGTEIAPYAARAEEDSLETVKEDFIKDKSFSLNLHRLVQLQDEWIVKENDYRQMLKTEDKKHMKEADYVQLNARQERNRLFGRVLALFPSGFIDLPSLRAMSKGGKGKGAARKTTTTVVSTKAIATAAAIKSPTTTPKRKLPVVVVADTTPAKRLIKPFKSRIMDEAPPFVALDFEEILD